MKRRSAIWNLEFGIWNARQTSNIYCEFQIPNSKFLIPCAARHLRWRLREHEQLCRHVAVECDRAQVLIGLRVVQVDGVAGDVNVQHLAVRAGLQSHARAAFEFRASRELAVLEVELPELVAANIF